MHSKINFMTVQDLIDKLYGLDKPELQVGVYCDISEDGDKVSSVKIVNKDSHPYCKGDTILEMYPEMREEIVLIF